jgi:branched-chain amino acid aminotransferase
MMDILSVPVRKTSESRLQTYDFDNIQFGANPTDHMFTARYSNGRWHDAAVTPFQDLQLSPLALCLHYGQTVFEGFKAYRYADGNINVFRPQRHFERLNKSLERMCMPAVPGELFFSALHQLLVTENGWIPNRPDASLYLRPFVIATEPRIGVKVSDEYLFGIVCLPLASYYSKNLKVKVETNFVRAAAGGTGAAKCGGNYGAAFYPTQKAIQEGFDQVLWTDAILHEYIEESGTMNIAFIIDDTFITPPLSTSILAGVTRDSLLQLASDLGLKVAERPVSYKELEIAFKEQRYTEAFGMGTAAVISAIEMVDINGHSYYPQTSAHSYAARLKTMLNDIRTGIADDKYNWNYIIKIA